MSIPSAANPQPTRSQLLHIPDPGNWSCRAGSRSQPQCWHLQRTYCWHTACHDPKQRGLTTMSSRYPPDGEAQRLIGRIVQRISDIQQFDPATAELLAAVASHLRRTAQANAGASTKAPLQVRSIPELQPALKALREQCIKEAATAALGTSAEQWLRDPETARGASRLEVSRESRAQLLRLRTALGRRRRTPPRS